MERHECVGRTGAVARGVAHAGRLAPQSEARSNIDGAQCEPTRSALLHHALLDATRARRRHARGGGCSGGAGVKEWGAEDERRF